MDKIIDKILNFLKYNNNLKAKMPTLYDVMFGFKLCFITVPFILLILSLPLIQKKIIKLFKKIINICYYLGCYDF